MTPNQYFIIAILLIVAILTITLRAMHMEDKEKDRNYFRDLVSRGMEIENDEDEEQDIEDIISPDNSDRGKLDYDDEKK